MRKLTKEEFIKRSINMYGEGTFDYSFVIYSGLRRNVEMVCNQHGTHFLQTPNNHLKGELSCVCCKEGRRAQDILLKLRHRVENKFGNIYTIDSIELSSGRVKGCCSFHGEFGVPRSTIVTGIPCKQCRPPVKPPRRKNPQKFDAKSFISRATDKFGTQYSYHKAEIVDRNTLVTITCKAHGDFIISPANHLKSKKGGCKLCASEACGSRFRHSHEEWVDKITETHGEKYKIVSSNITGNNRVVLECKLHGEFSISPTRAVEGQGCVQCTNLRLSETRRKGFESFYAQAISVHGNRYSYYPDDYVDAKTDIKIVCKEHGSFFQKPHNHTRGSGCPSCASYGYSRNSAGSVYLLESDNWIKVGITNRAVAERVASINSHSPEKLAEIFSISDTGDVCWQAERKMLSWLKTVSTPVDYEFDGSTETFLKIDRESAIKKLSEIHKEIKNE